MQKLNGKEKFLVSGSSCHCDIVVSYNRNHLGAQVVAKRVNMREGISCRYICCINYPNAIAWKHYNGVLKQGRCFSNSARFNSFGF